MHTQFPISEGRRATGNRLLPQFNTGIKVGQLFYFFFKIFFLGIGTVSTIVIGIGLYEGEL